jgi:hypothetical protein
MYAVILGDYAWWCSWPSFNYLLTSRMLHKFSTLEAKNELAGVYLSFTSSNLAIIKRLNLPNNDTHKFLWPLYRLILPIHVNNFNFVLVTKRSDLLKELFHLEPSLKMSSSTFVNSRRSIAYLGPSSAKHYISHLFIQIFHSSSVVKKQTQMIEI